MFCVRRLPALSIAEFHRYWFEHHAGLVRQHAAALRVRRYTQSHTLSDPRLAPVSDVRGGQVDPFDGVAELWWHSNEDLVDASATAEGRRAGRALLDDERNFIDLPNSPLFFTEEHVIIASID